MSLLGKLSLSLSCVSLIIMVSTRFILGGWINVLFVFLFLFVLGLILSFILDYRLYIGFLLMKTTRNGMSMGVSVLITLALCASLAYLSKSFEKSVDITEEKINSLAPQSVKILKSLKQDLRLTVFYKGAGGMQKKELVKNNLLLFKQASSKIKERYYDAYINNKLSQEYLNEVSNKEGDDIFVFMEYEGKRIAVESPYNEEKVTSALIKVTRRGAKTVYFLSGHGERDTDASSMEGLSEFRTALNNSSFNVKTWNFVKDGGALPGDVSALVIAGPRRPYLEKEIEWLEEYLNRGGRMLVALDPDRPHNLKGLLLKFRVDYKSRYIVDRVSAVLGLSRFSPMGVYFSPESAVTQSFKRGVFAVFNTVSDLEVAPPPAGAEGKDRLFTTELIKTNVNARSVPDVQSETQGERGSYVMGILVEEKNNAKENPAEKPTEEESAEEKSKENKKPSTNLMLAVFGDSDFLSNALINTRGVNRDLALNTISYLVDSTELVSIRPKRLKATQLILKQADQMGMILFAVILPVLFFIVSFVIWFRRREA